MILKRLEENYRGVVISEEVRTNIYFLIEDYLKEFTPDVMYHLFSVNISHVDNSFYVDCHNLQTAMLVYKEILIPKFADTYKDGGSKYYMDGKRLVVENLKLKTTWSPASISQVSKNDFEINRLKEKVKNFSMKG